MISLTISGSVFVEGATSEEEARAAVIDRAGATEISYVTRTGPDESPVYTVKLKDHVISASNEEVMEALTEVEEPTQEGEAAGKDEFEEIKE